MSSDLTVVLVHGAFADGASWTPVTRVLLDQGVTVRVPPVPLRSLLSDAAYVKRFVEQVGAPVLLVGHSYGGAVITVAGAADNVVGLVYVAGYALDEGETLNQLQGRFPASDLAQHLVTNPVTLPNGSDSVDVSVEVAAFPAIFADGVDAKVSDVLAVSQRPLAAVAFDEAAPVAAWKSKPAWGIVAANDHTINPDVERFGYTRAEMRGIIELPSPHLAMFAHPDDLAKVITDAIAEVA